MDKFLTLLDLQKSARDAGSLESFGFSVVNATQKLVPYAQALFWLSSHETVRLKSASGNVVIDLQGEQTRAIQQVIEQSLKDKTGSAKSLSREDLRDSLKESFAGHAVNLVFRTEKEGILGGLWIERSQPFHEAEIHVLEELSQSYAQSLALLNLRGRNILNFSLTGRKLHWKFVAAAAVVVCLFPVRLSVSAPAEIIAREPSVITIPYDGVLEKVLVRPGDSVAAGQVIASMDKTTLGAQMEMAAQDLESAQATLARLSREALASPDKKAELNLIQSDIQEKKIDFEHARKLLERSVMLAPKSGVAIFSDPSSIEGKPLSAGEKIMIIADPEQSELLIRIPADALIPLDTDSPVRFHLNVEPLGSRSATITSIGYQASPDPDGLLTYKVRANFSGAQDVRIGWKGSASIKGDWSIFSYALLRRPLIALRNLAGI